MLVYTLIDLTTTLAVAATASTKVITPLQAQVTVSEREDSYFGGLQSTMSDYEGEWEAVEVSHNRFERSIADDAITSCVVPKGWSQPNVSSNRLHKLHKPREYAQRHLPSTYRPKLQTLKPAAHFRTGGRFMNQPKENESLEDVSSRVFRLPAYARYQSNKDSPDEVFEMLHAYEHFCKAITVHGQHKSGKRDTTNKHVDLAKDKLAGICISTDAFIEIPNLNSSQFKIWGSSTSIEKAKQILQAWEMHVKRPGYAENKSVWTRGKAYDGREQHRNMLAAIQDLNDTYFQQSFDSHSSVCSAYLVWPDGYDLEQFIKDYDKDALEYLRHHFKCLITHDRSKVRATKIEAEDDNSVLSVYDRLMCLAKEMMARRRKGIKSNQCRYPSHGTFQENVILRKSAISETNPTTLVIPQLSGPTLPPQETEDWTELATRYHDECLSITKSALRSSLAALHVSEKYVRMRIMFGDFGLAKYKKPEGGKEYYRMHDFITMVQHRDVEMQQIPIIVGDAGKDYQSLVEFTDNVDKMDEFGKPRVSWTVKFDFQNANTTNLLRLETEFQPSYIDPNAPEKSASRWLNFSVDTTQDIEDIFEVSMMDFERVGCKFHIGAIALVQNDRINKDLQSFGDNVRFLPGVAGLKSHPRKQAIFPPGHRELCNVQEITSARYPFKNTGGLFEIQRIDIYPETHSRIASTPVRTEWHASYFYPGWDDLLSAMANIRYGEDVEWSRTLSTFFPQSDNPDNCSSLPNGFTKFMSEVEEIQDLLTIALKPAKCS